MNDGITSRIFSLRDLFDGKTSYTIDYYQREYTWSTDDVRTLVNDLCGQFAKYSQGQASGQRMQQTIPYFLGPFVYYQSRNATGPRYLVDGQQRFTTLHLIFIHLRRMLVDLDERKAAEMLDRAIKRFNEHGQPEFLIRIQERDAALLAFYEGRPYEPPFNASLSVRNLVTRGREIDAQLQNELDAETLPDFATWLLNRVNLVAIRAMSKNNAYRIFETMNDRGARLTSVDLLKSFLLSNVGRDEEKLNDDWRGMLAKLTAIRDDHNAAKRFLTATLIARYARGTNFIDDANQIEQSLNIWVQQNRDHLKLVSANRFFDFIQELTRLADHYATFLAAARRLDKHHGLEAIYYNEISGLGDQMIAILAAVRPNDTNTIAKDKARRIANFVDRWYVLRIVGDQPVQQQDLKELMGQLIEALRSCESPEDVTTVLDGLDRTLFDDDSAFSRFGTFGLGGNNKRQIRYLLARITAYVAVGCKKPNEIESYLSSDHPWQIEHVFANHQKRHPEINDPVVFQATRNQLGVLVLLPGSDNSSLADLPYAEKIYRYSRQNDLAAILSPGHRDHNPTLLRFARDNDVESLFRSFKDNDKIAHIARVRQDLYLRLCERIWDPVRLGIRHATTASVPDMTEVTVHDSSPIDPNGSAKRVKQQRETQLGKLVKAGVVKPGDKIVGVFFKRDYWATLEGDGAIKLDATGARYRKPDDAGYAVCRRICRGMEFWKVVKPDGERISLRQLYDDADRDGKLKRTRRKKRAKPKSVSHVDVT